MRHAGKKNDWENFPHSDRKVQEKLINTVKNINIKISGKKHLKLTDNSHCLSTQTPQS